MSTEKHQFQAEIQQLLNIVIHSLYTDKEIFIRELVSNAADACEKLRYTQASGQAVYQPETELKITVTTDKDAGTITITDAGIGMTHDEIVQNLGTIAHSGTKAFLKQMAEGQKPDLSLIGQFGVGFYSAFMVATNVTVYSRSWRVEEQGWKWVSAGEGSYEVEPVADLARGTKIVLTLKEEAKLFSEEWEVEHIIKRYSSFVTFPIELNTKRLNTVQAIWARSKNEIKDEEYNEFYRYIGHDTEDPMFRLHFSADAPLSIQALLFVPKKNAEANGMTRLESEVNLHCRKVLIQAKAKGLFPEWLRFLRGVVDSEDLPLNISRESMQDSSLMQKLNKVLTTRFLKFLDEQSTKEAEKYTTFYREFQRFLKEGVVTDFTHREALGKLLRFTSSATEGDNLTSLSEYVSRMGSEQKEIYFLLAADRAAAEASPYFEVFKARKFEVLFLNDPWDEFVMDHLREFEGKDLVAAEKADLALNDKPTGGLSDDDAAALAKWFKETLTDRVGEVRASKRLVDSPVAVVDGDKFMTSSMRRIIKAMGKGKEAEATPKLDLELNQSHDLMVRLNGLRQNDGPLAALLAEQLFDNARLSVGLLEDSRSMVQRMNQLLGKLAGGEPTKAS
jgi:TNF receptor-associated protein 1